MDRSGLPLTNLSVETTRFIGRSDQLSELSSLFDAGRQLVTVCGAAGVGKTRLVREYGGARLVSRAQREPWFCDLTQIATLDGLVDAVSATLRLPLHSSGSEKGVVQVGRALAARGPLLLILDNFEQLVEVAAKALRRWCEAAPRAQLLVTSREALDLEGEAVLELGPLSEDEAVELFVDRARAVRSNFTVRSAERALVAQIIQRLDAVPLAIELAAARTGVLGPRQLLERLSEGFQVLAGGPGPEKSRSTRAAIAWSWNLLEPKDQLALTRCSVFRGGFSIAAAEAVLGPEALDLLQSLRSKSLLRSYEVPAFSGELRFGLLQTIHDFALEKLASHPARAETLERHRAHYLLQAEKWSAGANGVKAAECLARLELELENLMAVYRRSLAGSPSDAARSALALNALLSVRGPWKAQLSVLEGALAVGSREAPLVRGQLLCAAAEVRLQKDHPPEAAAAVTKVQKLIATSRLVELRAEGLHLQALLLRRMGRVKPAKALAERALQSARGGDTAAKCERLVGLLCKQTGDLAGARRHFLRALRLSRGGGDLRGQASALGNLGNCHAALLEHSEARRCYGEALEICRGLGDGEGEAKTLGNLGLQHEAEHRFDEARACYDRAVQLCRDLGDRPLEARELRKLGTLEQGRGQLTRARGYQEQALALHLEFEDLSAIASTRLTLGMIDAEEGQLEQAKRQMAQALVLTRRLGEVRLESMVLAYLASVEAQQGHLGAAQRQFKAGRLLAKAGGYPEVLASLESVEGLLQVQQARAAISRGALAQARALVATVNQQVAGHHPVEADIAPARIAARMLARALDRIELLLAAQPRAGETAGPAQIDAALAIGPEGRWFRLPGGEPVELGRRLVLRRLLIRLVEQRELAPGSPLTVEALFEGGWPEQRILRGSITNRVYVAIATLRTLGLRGAVVTRAEGYLLDPRLSVIRVGELSTPPSSKSGRPSARE